MPNSSEETVPDTGQLNRRGFGHRNLYQMRQFYMAYPRIFQTVSGKSLAKQSTRQCLAICEAREIHSLNLGRDFGGGAFDEIGGTEPPELSKLVASNFSSSRHALQGLGVNPQKRCGLFCVDQRLKTWITGCRDPSGWFL